MAEIQVDLINEGAIGVGWVISFPQADRMGGDEVFAQTLGYVPSVIAMFEDGKNKYPIKFGPWKKQEHDDIVVYQQNFPFRLGVDERKTYWLFFDKYRRYRLSQLQFILAHYKYIIIL